MPRQEEQNIDIQREKANIQRSEYFIQTLGIKEENGLTRIYSAIGKTENSTPEENKNEQS